MVHLLERRASLLLISIGVVCPQRNISAYSLYVLDDGFSRSPGDAESTVCPLDFEASQSVQIFISS